MAIMMSAAMRADGVLCFLWPWLARYRVVVLDQWTGDKLDMPMVRFRWGRTAAAWIFWADARHERLGVTAQYSIQRLP